MSDLTSSFTAERILQAIKVRRSYCQDRISYWEEYKSTALSEYEQLPWYKKMWTHHPGTLHGKATKAKYRIIGLHEKMRRLYKMECLVLEGETEKFELDTGTAEFLGLLDDCLDV